MGNQSGEQTCYVLNRGVNGFIFYTMKNIFRRTFSYNSPYPNLEGIKDALSYNIRGLMIGQNCCAVCINKGVMA